MLLLRIAAADSGDAVTSQLLRLLESAVLKLCLLLAEVVGRAPQRCRVLRWLSVKLLACVLRE